MKFFKAIMAIVLLSVAVLLLIGVFVPEVDCKFETRVDRPVISVFPGMMASNSLTEWVGGLESVERTGGLLVFPGSTFNLQFRGKETSGVYELEILEMDPLQKARFRLHSDILEMTVSVNFKADGLQTDMETYVQIKGKGLVSRAFIPLMRSVVMDEVKRDFEHFKQYQEQ